MSDNTEMKSQRGQLKLELILTALATVGVPIGGGIWVGSIQKQVNSTEVRIDKVEQLPVNVAVLQTEMAAMRQDVRDTKDEVRGMREDLKEVTDELRR